MQCISDLSKASEEISCSNMNKMGKFELGDTAKGSVYTELKH